ncbi:MAG TPA: c-type cytochrome [Bryobacteraceae bacterium]|jgi:hypothetical protein|nr:c-type cytochrome [Bryobacteraceae bacterium]
MRLLIALAVVAPLIAQEPQPNPPHREHPAPKNLKLLKPDEVMPTMHAFRIALGEKCSFCHVDGDFASDANPHKEIARKMIVLARDINAKFPDGKTHVTCYTCHRGNEHPATAPPEGDAAK